MSALVSAAWLASRIADPALAADTIVLDATLPPVGVQPVPDMRASYLACHIPGALFFDIDELSDHSTPLPHMLPDAATFAAAMGQLGIRHEATIVVYEQQGVFSAPRAWWMLRSFGARHVVLLDGGLNAWKAAGLACEQGNATRTPTSFQAQLNHSAVVPFDELRSMLDGIASGADSTQLLDARSAARFTAAAPEPRPGLPSGHIPGATSLPFTTLVDDGRMRSAEQLRKIFAERGVNLNRPIMTTCGSGVTAAVVLLAAELAGASGVRLYDGSWAEYASQPDSIIVTGSASA
jgi:thiosulfate/3-mercaptopyruvate sulfurtransferase